MKSGHVLIPVSLWARLSDLCARTRVTQADYIREAVNDLLALHGDRSEPMPVDPARFDGELVSLVYRIPDESRRRLWLLVERTRVRISEYMREAIWRLLQKHAAKARAA